MRELSLFIIATFILTLNSFAGESYIINSSTQAISPNLGLSNDTIEVDLSIRDISINRSTLYFRSSNYDYIAVFNENGDSTIWSDSDFRSNQGILNLDPSKSECNLKIRIHSGEQVILPLVVGPENQIRNEINSKNVFYNIFIGIFISIILYNLFLFFSIGDSLYIIYVLTTLFIGLVQLQFSGKLEQWFFGNSMFIRRYDTHILGALSGITTIWFSNIFIRIKHYCNWVFQVSKVAIAMYVISICFALFGQLTLSYQLINLNASISLLLIVAAIYSIRKGYRQGKFFLIAWTFFLFGVTVFALKDFGLLPFNNFTNFALPVGSVVEILLLSFALADRINVLKQEKELSQQQAFLAIQENEKLVREQNIQLEQKVHERTVDLESRNNELNQALLELRTTQKQLAESDKMASIGQMTAGIAHEMNNPINFVQSNVIPLKRDIDDILDLISDANALEINEQLPLKIEAFKKKYKEYDIDFVKDEIVQLLSGIEDGAKRTAEIVRGLRVFSRMDRNELVSADINECLYSTLVVMKNMTKAEVTLNVDLGDNIPKIDCYPGKLSQVFMNLVTNAVQATRIDGRQPKDRVIDVKSFMENNRICVTISDNGTGIPEELQEKIFEPFFTTKGVGEGTGLGLSIVAGIIGEHKGAISFESISGKGTTFLVTLPITN